jgi:hypothetical protein
METQGEELSKLRAELASSKDLLTSKDAQLAQSSVLIASKDQVIASQAELLSSRAEEVARLSSLVQTSAGLCARVTTMEVEAGTSATKRQRSQDSSSNGNGNSSSSSSSCSCSTVTSVLERDELLDKIFSYVGGGDHLYVAGVSRKWRGNYLTHCVQYGSSKVGGKLMTRRRNVLLTESRLQLALSSGLTVAGWTFDKEVNAELIYKHSLEPEKVMTLLRVHGVPWSTLLCDGAAYYNKLAFLQWLHAHSCPWQAHRVLAYTSARGTLSMLQWLLSVMPPWSHDVQGKMFVDAACQNELAVAQWLRAQGAPWSESFSARPEHAACAVRMSWQLPAVQ